MKTYQNIITATNPEKSRNTVKGELRKRNIGTTRTKITRINAIILKSKITKRMISTGRKRSKNGMQTTSQKT